jgi:hypothetical protein
MNLPDSTLPHLKPRRASSHTKHNEKDLLELPRGLQDFITNYTKSQPTPWCGIVTEKLTVIKLLKKMPPHP